MEQIVLSAVIATIISSLLLNSKNVRDWFERHSRK